MTNKRITVIIGTRPEAIKMAPVVHALRASGKFDVTLLSTGQHRDMLPGALATFGLQVDVDLALMRAGQSWEQLADRILPAVGRYLSQHRPDSVLVHGDTTTCLYAALAAAYLGIAIGHVEAGLRSHNMRSPWPEEMNRTLTDLLSQWCFAPTADAAANLYREGIAEKKITVTGNTVIDALFTARETGKNNPGAIPGLDPAILDEKFILVTAHRQEKFGQKIRDFCHALMDIRDENPEVHLLYPVHVNPHIDQPVRQLLSHQQRIHLLAPLAYLEFIYVMDRCTLILTDSGGIQEEAPSLNKPVIMARTFSERPEVLNTGAVLQAGEGREQIVLAVSTVLQDETTYHKMSQAGNPYGDGNAAQRIVTTLTKTL